VFSLRSKGSSEFNAIMNDGPRGYTLQVEKLVGGEPQHIEDIAVDPMERTRRRELNHVVDLGSPAQGAQDDFGGQRSIAGVREGRA